METTTNTRRRTFLTAAALLPGDILIASGVHIASVEPTPAGNVAITYRHRPGVVTEHFAHRRFHVARKIGA